MSDKQDKGRWGEELAAAFLLGKGYEVRARNWRYSRAEVDIIAAREGLLVFVEVKVRKNVDFGTPASFVDEKKQILLADAASVYCEEHHHDGEIRFDVIGIVGEPGQGHRLEHLEDAFFPGLF